MASGCPFFHFPIFFFDFLAIFLKVRLSLGHMSDDPALRSALSAGNVAEKNSGGEIKKRI